MANSLYTGQRGGGRVQTEQSAAAEQLEEMHMNHYIHRIPQCQGCAEGCRKLREILECQTRLLGEILAVLDEMMEKHST